MIESKQQAEALLIMHVANFVIFFWVWPYIHYEANT